MSGDGGDECMAGYRKYKIHQREQFVRGLVPSWIRSRLFGTLARHYPVESWVPRVFRAGATLRNLSVDRLEAIYLSRACHDPELTRSLIRPERRAENYDSIEVLACLYRSCDAKDELSRELYVDTKSYLADDLLVKVDRASMAYGLEVRVPLLDHRFMEFAASIPSSLKLKRGRGKYLFKEAMRSRLGGAVDRKKMGFSAPVGEWLRGPLKSIAEARLFSGDAFVDEVLDLSLVRRLWNQHQSRRMDFGTILWAVLILELWARRYLSREFRAGNHRLFERNGIQRYSHRTS
jgi:asparagine synthase (glutamine-hydrolysing)